MATAHDPRRDEVLAALNEVYDPCSIASNAPLGLVDMGLLVSATVKADTIGIALCVTGPGCMMAGNIVRAATERLEQIEWARAVDVRVVMGPLWTPEQMTERGRAFLDARRRPAMERVSALRQHG